MTVPVSPEESGHGSANAASGGIGLRMFAKDDGEISYLSQHPTWVFPLSIQKARPLQTC